jgi:transcriptional regulator with XRE-family HTH domain
MMQQIGERIDMLCEALDVSRRKFAEKIGENPSTIASIVRGSSPSANIICSIIEHYPELNERWLLMGELPIWKKELLSELLPTDGKEVEALQQQIEHKNETISALKGQVTALEKTVELLEKQLLLMEQQQALILAKKAS